MTFESSSPSSDLLKLSEMFLTGTATATKYYLELTKQM